MNNWWAAHPLTPPQQVKQALSGAAFHAPTRLQLAPYASAGQCLEDLAAAGFFAQLRWLSVREPVGAQLAQILTRCAQLEFVLTSAWRASSPGLQWTPTTVWVDVVTTELMDALASFPNLRTLVVQQPSPHCLELLSQGPVVRAMEFRGHAPAPELRAFLKDVGPTLESLSLAEVTPDEFSDVFRSCSLPSLTSLSVAELERVDIDLAELLPTLSHLRAPALRIPLSEGLVSQLVSLHVHQDALPRRLPSSDRLSVLQVEGCDSSAAGDVGRSFPQLTELELRPHSTIECIDGLRRLGRLEKLTLERVDVQSRVDLPNPSLTHLALKHSALAAPVSGLPASLTHLDLTGTYSGSGVGQMLGDAPRSIQVLQLGNCDLRDAPAFASTFHSLRVLGVADAEGLRAHMLDGLEETLELLDLSRADWDEARDVWMAAEFAKHVADRDWPRLTTLLAQPTVGFAALENWLRERRAPLLNHLEASGDQPEAVYRHLACDSAQMIALLKVGSLDRSRVREAGSGRWPPVFAM